MKERTKKRKRKKKAREHPPRHVRCARGVISEEENAERWKTRVLSETRDDAVRANCPRFSKAFKGDWRQTHGVLFACVHVRLDDRCSQADPKMSSYLLAVTSGAHLHPPTLCAAENILKKHPCPSRVTKQQQQLQQQQQQRTEPEGLHCVRKSRLTLTGVKYNTTYHFTLYIVSCFFFNFYFCFLLVEKWRDRMKF